MAGAADDIPPLVPARMLNEFAYCPRLFHLEWVQGEFADNDETVHGRSVHRRVDRPGHRLPPPDEVDGPVSARSVMLDAPLLGLIAKIDLIEGADGEVTPIERKRGRPRTDGFVWEPEEMQVVAQALILRENGYSVTEGIISFPEVRQRVHVELTEERVARLGAHLGDLRATAAGPVPAPLIDSPKCPRCSLVGICLPDETRRLRAVEADPASEGGVRRLVAPADDARPLYVQEQGARIGRRGDRILVTKDTTEIASLRAIDVSHVSVYGNVSVSAPALRGFCEADVPITHHTYGGWLVGVTTGPGHRNAELRIRQFAAAGDSERSLAVARRIVGGKIRNARTILRRNHRGDIAQTLRGLRRDARQAERAQSAPRLLGIEGVAARRYFGAFTGLLSPAATLAGFDFTGRNRRPPRDPVNALLSFGYSLLVRDVTASVIRVGLDPYVGLFHRPRYGRPSLALDLAEEFRPIVADSVVIGVVNTREIVSSDFVERGGAYALTAPGRRTFIEAYERRMATQVRHPIFGYTVSYRRLLDLQARVLARLLTGEIESYRPFTTR